MKELEERAVEIHKVILNIAREETLVVGFPNKHVYRDAYQRLKLFRYKKPFFSSVREWTRQAIVFEPTVYNYFAPNVELEFIEDGSLVFFNGVGHRTRYGIHWATMANLQPTIYWVICLGSHLEKFRVLLDYDFRDS